MTVAGKPISNYRLRTRQPQPSPPPGHGIVKPPLWEFVLLSMLLHATAIVLFGAPSGVSREGRAMWGALQVVLQAAPVDAGPSLKIDRGLLSERPAVPKKKQAPRVVPEPRIEPIAPQLKFEPRVESLIPPIESAPAPLTPQVAAPVVIPPLLDRIVTPDRIRELTPFRLPPPTPVQATPVPIAPPPAPAPPAPIEKPPIPRVERATAEPPPVPAPVVQPVPLPIPVPESVIATPAEISPVASPVIPALPATPTVERPPVEVPALPAPVESIAVPQVAAPPVPATITQPVQTREAPAKIERAPVPSDAPSLQPAPFRPAGPSIDSPVNRAGEPATKFDPTAPTLDLDAMRKRAGEMARAGTGNRAVLPFPMPPVPPKKSKMETAIENARKPDCRTAYAQMGLLAVVPLVANEFGEGNCRW